MALSYLGVYLTFFLQFTNHQVSGLNCGRVSLIRQLVLGGNSTLKSEWPFIVALYETRSRSNKYICGGTLISNKHVLTAAHCVHRKYSSVQLQPNDVEVRLGAYNLINADEIEAVRRNVSEIYVHSDWMQYNENYDADISILVLSDNVTFTNSIQPVCMPARDDDTDSATIDVRGYVVGWGLSSKEIHEDIPRKIEAEAANNSNCYRADPGIIISSSNRSFCAKSMDGTPNRGDSGGGFFIVSRSTWEQYGIVSAIRTDETGHAARNLFAIYTNLAPFKKWIAETVKQSGSEVGKAMTRISLTCRYGFIPNFSYTCELNDLNIRNEDVEIVSISGAHNSKRDNDDVESVNFRKRYTLALPNGLGKIFTNLKNLKIGNFQSTSMGLRNISRSSLRSSGNLEKIFVFDNEIERLDEDCLWDLYNLTAFLIINNDLQVLYGRTFEKNEQLVDVRLIGNRL